MGSNKDYYVVDCMACGGGGRGGGRRRRPGSNFCIRAWRWATLEKSRVCGQPLARPKPTRGRRAPGLRPGMPHRVPRRASRSRRSDRPFRLLPLCLPALATGAEPGDLAWTSTEFASSQGMHASRCPKPRPSSDRVARRGALRSRRGLSPRSGIDECTSRVIRPPRVGVNSPPCIVAGGCIGVAGLWVGAAGGRVRQRRR